MSSSDAATFYKVLTVFYGIFGIVCIFIPQLMGLFYTQAGRNAVTEFSTHVTLHMGIDIASIAILVPMLPNTPVCVRRCGLIALGPAIATLYGLLFTNTWHPILAPIFILLPCALLFIWSQIIAKQMEGSTTNNKKM